MGSKHIALNVLICIIDSAAYLDSVNAVAWQVGQQLGNDG